MDVDLSEVAWALLGMLRRATKGGPVPLHFEDEFAELRANGLAKRNARGVMEITTDGEAAWDFRYGPSQPAQRSAGGSGG